MSFARQKRQLIGWLALLAPVPLPFNEVLEWSLLWLYLIVVVLFLRRARSLEAGWLPNWAMNLLGLGYLPFLYLDFATRWSGQLVRPVVHLAMFAVVIKLFALKRERDKWQTLFGVFFLFLASMATSVHPSILVYVITFLALTLVLLTRFSLYSVLARFGYREWSLQTVPLRGFVVVTTLLSIGLAVPLFALLPRIKSPYIMGRGVGSGTVIGASGFTDQVNLDSIGSIRQRRDVALRLSFGPEDHPGGEVRLKAATYETYDGRSWARSGAASPLTSLGPGTFPLTTPRPMIPRQWAYIWLQPLGSRSLPVPVEAESIELRANLLNQDRGGAISMLFPPSQILEYRVGLDPAGEVHRAIPPDLENPREPTLDLGGVTPAIRDYAARVLGQSEGVDRLRILENHLAAGTFRYTTDLVGRRAESPIEEFLLTTKEGHCEYFASAMVLLLRSEGIPARLVTGFLGAEISRFEDYYVVRQSNAHAWVEAYVDGSGWITLDPTPPDGRPGVEPQEFGAVFAQVWDYISFRWDRYVLTFGFADQFQIASRLSSIWRSFWRVFESRSEQEDEEPTSAPVEVPVEVSQVEGEPESRDPSPWLQAGFLVFWLALLVLGLLLWRRFRQPVTPTRAYLDLRRRFGEAGVAIETSLAPLAFQERATSRFPELGPAVRLVTAAYLKEAFGREGRDDPQSELEESLAQVAAGLKRAG